MNKFDGLIDHVSIFNPSSNFNVLDLSWNNFSGPLAVATLLWAKCGGEAQHLEKVKSWSPPGLPNVQSSTAGPKTPRIGMFLMSLKRS
jgi:hypothetical protein